MAGEKGNGAGKEPEGGKIYDFMHARLVGAPLSWPDEKAKAYALFCQSVYNFIQDNHDLEDGLNAIANSNQLQPMARQLGLARSVQVLGDVRLSGSAGVVNVFVDKFKEIAKHCGIEVNECAFCVGKVALDLASAGVGAVSSVTGVGMVWLALSVVATFQDSYDLGQVCFVSQ